jgi:hypothetical protein
LSRLNCTSSTGALTWLLTTPQHIPDHISELGESDGEGRQPSVGPGPGEDSRAHRTGYKGDMAKWEENTKGACGVWSAVRF